MLDVPGLWDDVGYVTQQNIIADDDVGDIMHKSTDSQHWQGTSYHQAMPLQQHVENWEQSAPANQHGGQSSSQAPSQQGTRIRFCDFWSRNGNCLHGDSCKFHHDPTVPARPLQESRTSRTVDNDGRTSKERDKRSQSHSRSPVGALSPSQPGGAPRRVCDFFAKYGNCRAGRSCKFLHVAPPFSVQQQQQQQQQQLVVQALQQMHQHSIGTSGFSDLSRTGSPTASQSGGPAPSPIATGFYWTDGEMRGAEQEMAAWGSDMDAMLRDWRDPLKGRDWEFEDGRGGGWRRDVTNPASMIPLGTADWMGGQQQPQPRELVRSTSPLLQKGAVNQGFALIGGKGMGLGMAGNVMGMGIGMGLANASGLVPTSVAKWAIGQDGTPWFLTGDGWAYNASGCRKRVCDFFDSKGNCRHGASCGFLHIARELHPSPQDEYLAEKLNNADAGLVSEMMSFGKGQEFLIGSGSGMMNVGGLVGATGTNLMGGGGVRLDNAGLGMGMGMSAGIAMVNNKGLNMAMPQQQPVGGGGVAGVGTYTTHSNNVMLMGSPSSIHNIGSPRSIGASSLMSSLSLSSMDSLVLSRSGSPRGHPINSSLLSSPRSTAGGMNGMSGLGGGMSSGMGGGMMSSPRGGNVGSGLLAGSGGGGGMTGTIGEASPASLGGDMLAPGGGGDSVGQLWMRDRQPSWASEPGGASSQADALWGDREGEVGRLADYLRNTHMTEHAGVV